jgi:hypothetical protein
MRGGQELLRVLLISSNEFTGRSTTIYADTIWSGDFSYNPRIHYQDTSGTIMGTNGSSGRIMVLDEKIYLIATNVTPGDVSATAISAVIFYEAK